MKKLKRLFKRIKKCAKNDINASDPVAMVDYVGDELDEVRDAIEYEQYGNGKRPDESSTDELADVVLAALGAFYNSGGTNKKLFSQLRLKTKKWAKTNKTTKNYK